MLTYNCLSKENILEIRDLYETIRLNLDNKEFFPEFTECCLIDLFDGGGLFIGAFDDSKIVACCYLVRKKATNAALVHIVGEDILFLGGACTLKEYRGRGIHKKMLNMRLLHCLPTDLPLIVTCHPDNIASIKNIEGAFFKDTGIIELNKHKHKRKIFKRFL